MLLEVNVVRATGPQHSADEIFKWANCPLMKAELVPPHLQAGWLICGMEFL